MVERIDPKIVPKVWGHEEIGINCDRYCGKILYLNEGRQCSIHRHKKDETFRILSGSMILEIGQDNDNMDNIVLRQGDWIRIPENYWHRFSGLSDCVFIEFSTPDVESQRKTQSRIVPDFVSFKKEVLKCN